MAEELLRHGIAVRPVVWDSPYGGLPEAVVIRSCWDYHLRADRFIEWARRIESVGAKLWNPAEVVKWNADKRYLYDLADRGIAIPETELPSPGETLAEVLERRGWSIAVVKPRISASAHETWVTSTLLAPSQQEAFDSLAARGPGCMVQEFLPEVVEQGEWSLMFFDGAFSHAVLKRPATGDFRVQHEHGGSTEAASPPPALISQAAAILRTVDHPILYARVDGIERSGAFILTELELIEPFLFLAYDPASPARFAEAINAYMRSR